MKRYALIVAGGKGLRMGKEIPKQFMELKSLPVLMHTIQAFNHFDSDMNIILVLPKEHFEFWEQLCEKHAFKIQHTLVEGGAERFFSVKNGLNVIEENDSVVAIHDGVRPLVSMSTLQRCFDSAAIHGSAIPVIESVNSVRIIEGETSKALERAKVRMVQTPQTFITGKIQDAFEKEFSSFFTDDASVYESNGKSVKLVDGNVENIKITHPGDLFLADYYMAEMKM